MSQNAMITLTPHAYWHLQWLCQRTPNEVSAMGLLQPSGLGFLVEDFILVRQEVAPAAVQLDMEWWADKQAELFDKHDIEPWRTSLWAHTHPAGINGPSPTDNETMEESFGGWNFVIMLILTKAGHFYARMDFDHDFGAGAKQRLSIPCEVEIDWMRHGAEPISKETLDRWNEEFKECVLLPSSPWLIFEDEPLGRTRSRKYSWLPKSADERGRVGPGRKELEDYYDACNNCGEDPTDPDNFENFFGYKPEIGIG